MGWSLVHEDTKTQIEMISHVKATDNIANGEMDLVYKKKDGSVEKVSLQGETNMDQRKAFVKVQYFVTLNINPSLDPRFKL